MIKKDYHRTTISSEEQILIDNGLSEQQAHEIYIQARTECMEEKLNRFAALMENKQED